MSKTLRCILVVCVALALLAAGCNVEASNSRPLRNNDISTMADALKYLQDLDTYYADRARVRFGKRSSLMHRLLENNINSNNNNAADLTQPHVNVEFATGEDIF